MTEGQMISDLQKRVEALEEKVLGKKPEPQPSNKPSTPSTSGKQTF